MTDTGSALAGAMVKSTLNTSAHGHSYFRWYVPSRVEPSSDHPGGATCFAPARNPGYLGEPSQLPGPFFDGHRCSTHSCLLNDRLYRGYSRRQIEWFDQYSRHVTSATEPPPYDPTQYKGSAPFYLKGRPPYSRKLRQTIAVECRLDGTGRLLDVGSGPGVLAVELAPVVEEAIGLEPDADMLVEAARHATEAHLANISWVQGLAEEIPNLDLGTFRLVTFGQSFHRTDRERVAEAVYELLEPDGSILLVAHCVEGRPKPPGPGLPEIPHEAIRSLIGRYLGSLSRSGQGVAAPPVDRWEDALGRTRFGRPRHIFAPGRPDIVQDVDGVLANYLSMSYAAPHLFGNRLEQFEAEVRQELTKWSPSGLFWDWPGDTEIAIAAKST